MKRLTKFEIMRRNQRKRRVMQEISELGESEAEWAVHEAEHRRWRDEKYADTAEWLADMRAAVLPLHWPQALRRHWWQFWKPRAKVAAPVIGHDNEGATQWA